VVAAAVESAGGKKTRDPAPDFEPGSSSKTAAPALASATDALSQEGAHLLSFGLASWLTPELAEALLDMVGRDVQNAADRIFEDPQLETLLQNQATWATREKPTRGGKAKVPNGAARGGATSSSGGHRSSRNKRRSNNN